MTCRCPNEQYYFERIPLSQNIEYRVFNEMAGSSPKMPSSCTSVINARGHAICTTSFPTLKNNKHCWRLESSRFPRWPTDCKSRQSMIPTTMPGHWKRPRDASRSRQDASWCIHQRSSRSIPRAPSQTLERGPD